MIVLVCVCLISSVPFNDHFRNIHRLPSEKLFFCLLKLIIQFLDNIATIKIFLENKGECLISFLKKT